jgi:hypothetical protein
MWFLPLVQVVEATFGASIAEMRGSYVLTYADPILSCSALTNADSIKGTVVLMQRGTSPKLTRYVSQVDRAGCSADVGGTE